MQTRSLSNQNDEIVYPGIIVEYALISNIGRKNTRNADRQTRI